MAASLLYFVLIKNRIVPGCRMTAVLSALVMTSALLMLLMQQQNWRAAYQFNGEVYALKPGARSFTGGYRYPFSFIDVPILLIQMLFAAQVTGERRKVYVRRFGILGTLMITAGYVGQFFEPGGFNENPGAWYAWAAVSTVFFVWVLILITGVIRTGVKNAAGSRAAGLLGAVLPIFFIAWFLYPAAYLMPALWRWGGLAYEFVIAVQQITYTAADVLSKIIYGLLLSAACAALSDERNFTEV